MENQNILCAMGYIVVHHFALYEDEGIPLPFDLERYFFTFPKHSRGYKVHSPALMNLFALMKPRVP